MGQMTAVNRLPDDLREKLNELVNTSHLTEQDIANIINEEAGKKVITRSSVNRYVNKLTKMTNRKRGQLTPTVSMTVEESFARIAIALEKIAFCLDKQNC
jgi:hypothetical protein